MGNSFSNEEFVIEHCKEYLPLERADITWAGNHIYAKFMEDNCNFKAGDLVKIDVTSNRILNRVFLSDSIIHEIRISFDEKLIAYRTQSEFVLRDIDGATEWLRVPVKNCSFAFSINRLVFQKSQNTFSCFDLKTRQLTDYFKNSNRIQSISQLSADSNGRFVFFVVQHHSMKGHFIAKFNLAEGKFAHLHKSSSRVKRLVYSESRELLAVAKESGTITVYSVKGNRILNLKNFKLGENIQYIKVSQCGKFLLGCVLVFSCLKFYIWNLDQLDLIATYKTKKESDLLQSAFVAMLPSVFSVLHFTTRQIIAQVHNKLCFFSLIAPSEEPKSIFDFGYLTLPESLNSKKNKLFTKSFKSSTSITNQHLINTYVIQSEDKLQSPKSHSIKNDSSSPQNYPLQKNKVSSTSDEESDQGDKNSRIKSPRSSQTLDRWRQQTANRKLLEEEPEEIQLNSNLKSLNLTHNKSKDRYSKFYHHQYESDVDNEEDLEDFSERESPWEYKRTVNKIPALTQTQERLVMRFLPESNSDE